MKSRKPTISERIKGGWLMVKTDKYNNMIQAFECDFTLARDGKRALSELQNKIEKEDERLMADIKLLEELSYLLRYGKAEIMVKESD